MSLHDWDQLALRDGLWVGPAVPIDAASLTNKRNGPSSQPKPAIYCLPPRSANLVEDGAFDEMGQGVCPKKRAIPRLGEQVALPEITARFT